MVRRWLCVAPMLVDDDKDDFGSLLFFYVFRNMTIDSSVFDGDEDDGYYASSGSVHMMRKMSVYSVRLNYIALHIALRYSTLIPSRYKCSPMYVHTPMHAFIRAYTYTYILAYLHTSLST